MKIAYAGAALALAALSCGASHAQQAAYPSKPVRMILPFAPGGPSDIIGRLLSQNLTQQLGQSVIADNRAGAGGNLGLELAAKAPPDGYTIVLASPTISISPSLYRKLGYDAQKEFASRPHSKP